MQTKFKKFFKISETANFQPETQKLDDLQARNKAQIFMLEAGDNAECYSDRVALAEAICFRFARDFNANLSGPTIHDLETK